MRKPYIGVVGLTGQSVFMKVDHLPRVGETVKSKELFTEAGGKGHNQAVACSRLGSDCVFIGAVGSDFWGQVCKEDLVSRGVEAVLMEKVTGTACAFIMTDDKGDNIVSVYTGASRELTMEDIRSEVIWRQLKKCDLLLAQMELPEDCLQELVDLSKERSIPLLLNPAPAKELEPEFINRFYAITPNEEEAKILLGITPNTKMTPLELGEAMLEVGIQRAVITLGGDGALLVDFNEIRHFPPYKISKVIDTTGAGDTFNGALASCIAQSMSMAEAVEFAIVAAGLSVTKKGACNSIPTEEEVKQAIVSYRVGRVYE